LGIGRGAGCPSFSGSRRQPRKCRIGIPEGAIGDASQKFGIQFSL
jgi:hypothetical protein